MNNKFQISQWLKNQPTMPSPNDDFDQIYQQLRLPKTQTNSLSVWAVAAGIALLVIGMAFFHQPIPSADNQPTKTVLSQLQQQVSQLEQQLQESTAVIVSKPGSAQLENQVVLEQWLEYLNNRLAASQDAQQQRSLLQAKLTVLQNLKPNNQTIQLI